MSANVQSVDQKKAAEDLSPHQKVILDYASEAVRAVASAQSDELAARTRVIVNAEIRNAFELHNRLTLGRKVTLGVGAVAVFALGWFGRSWASRNDRPDTVRMQVD